jgi:hypothetical protein
VLEDTCDASVERAEAVGIGGLACRDQLPLVDERREE